MTGTWMSSRRAFIGGCLAIPVAAWSEPISAPALMLAASYREGQDADLSEFWVSEKLDGVRAYWDGARLLTRAGNVIAAPGWFTARLPTMALDGELWGGRKSFERTSGVVRSSTPDDSAWRALAYMVFDLPHDSRTFDERVGALLAFTARNQPEWLLPIVQSRVADADQLQARLREIEALGGEGLMLHRGASRYAPGRSADLLKVKSFDDAEAKVIGHVPGNGKYTGMLGALWVERADGARFKIGSGFTDEQRAHPPAIGEWVTYAYNGNTNSGLPRFPRFIRMQSE